MSKRHLLIPVTFFLSLLLYIDRACISVAKGPITSELNLTEKEMGWVMAIFTLGYALAQTPSGALADRLGPRKVLTGVVALWSLFTALTGMVSGYVSMLFARFTFGAAEAGAFPGMARASLSWFPVKERGLVTGINFSASRLGGALALPLMVWLIDLAGWRGAFYTLGGVGVGFAIFWYFVFRDDPADHPLVSDEETTHIHATRQQVSASSELPPSFGRILSSKQSWLAMGQYFCSNFTFFFCLTWLYPYVKETYHLTSTEAGMMAAIPLLGGAAGNWISGWLVDKLFTAKGLVLSRRVPAVVGFACATIGLLASQHMDSQFGAIAFLTLAVFGADMTLSPSWSFCVDIGGRAAGAVSGTMNMAGNLGAFVTTLAFPYLKSIFDGSVGPFFYIAAALNFVAIALWLMMDNRKVLV
ncbi:MFS transporter [Verrucomicrobiaceae bacterium 227]